MVCGVCIPGLDQCVRWSESLIEFLSVIDLSTGSAAVVSEVTSSHRRVVAASVKFMNVFSVCTEDDFNISV